MTRRARKTAADEAERQGRENYVMEHAAGPYLRVGRYLRARFNALNQRFFDDRLTYRHIDLGCTPSRCVAMFGQLTTYGAPGQITIKDRLALGTNDRPDDRWVNRGFPAEGLRRCLEDLLFRPMAEQAVWEWPELQERELQGEGHVALVIEQLNRIAPRIGVPTVTARRRPTDDEDIAVYAAFPFHGRDDDYFLGDVTPKLLSLLRGGRRRASRKNEAPSVSIYAYLLRLLQDRKYEKLESICQRQRDLYEDWRLGRLPQLRRFEKGDLDVDGKTPLPKIVIDPAWLAWGNSLVAGVAAGILRGRRFDEVPILADALEDAGCTCPFILRHLRHRMEHTRSCWVLAALAQAGAVDEQLAPTAVVDAS